ncbi:MAG: hypothetical protein U0798_20835 [Gemmataceae bacterium]
MAFHEAFDRFQNELRALIEVVTDVREQSNRLIQPKTMTQSIPHNLKRMAKDPFDPRWNEKLLFEKPIQSAEQQLPSIEIIERIVHQLNVTLTSEVEYQFDTVLSALKQVNLAINELLTSEQRISEIKRVKHQLTLF